MNDTIEQLATTPTLGRRVYEVLERLIIQRQLAPGERLVETDLAERLGVSRGPVREALQQLQRDGWVDLRPRQGAAVHRPTLREVDEFFAVRAVLEGEAARLAARDRDAHAMSALRDALDHGRSLGAAAGDVERLNANATLHRVITGLAGNRMLADLVERLGKRTRWFVAPLVLRRAGVAWQEHAEIVDAIEAGDAAGAELQMREHIDAVREASKRHAVDARS